MLFFGKKTPCCNGVIVAAGTASRMGGIDKVMEPLGGIPMVIRSALAFQNCPLIQRIVIVTRQDLLEPIGELCAQYGVDKLHRVVPGGPTRTDSVCRGLESLPEDTELVAVHDGARPLVTGEVIDQAVTRARRSFAAAPAVPVKDTIKLVEGDRIAETPDRSRLRAVQTPQVFDLDLLTAALENARQKNLTLTDECSAVEALGKAVYLTAGSDENLKITTPVDLILAEAILNRREQK